MYRRCSGLDAVNQSKGAKICGDKNVMHSVSHLGNFLEQTVELCSSTPVTDGDLQDDAMRAISNGLQWIRKIGK